MRIALDAMGGDHAPERPVAGALAALDGAERDLDVVLVGDRTRLAPLLPAAGRSRLSVRHASQTIGMEEAPATALRRKPDSSIGVGVGLQATGEADAFVSAGNTGAVMAAALTTLGRIKGISRPAIMTAFPTQAEPCIVLDVGANAQCKPHHLAQFAVMGHIYATEVLGRVRPRVGLLSIGEESGKGDDLRVAAHALLSAGGLNFVGNVEGRDVLRGAVDVVVTDGFTGNVLLKFGESLVDFLAGEIGHWVRSSRRAALGAWLLEPAFRELRARIDYAEYGGAPLLGVHGVVIVCHGGSSAKAFENAFQVARRAVERDLEVGIERALVEFGSITHGPADGREGSAPDPVEVP